MSRELASFSHVTALAPAASSDPQTLSACSLGYPARLGQNDGQVHVAQDYQSPEGQVLRDLTDPSRENGQAVCDLTPIQLPNRSCGSKKK